MTGGGGFVGSLLARSLLARGDNVRVIDSFIFGRDSLRSLMSQPGLEIVEGDIRDADEVRRSLRRVDAVVHLAAIANDPSADLDPSLTRAVNRDAVIDLVRLSREAGVRRFVNASSASVYGVRDGPPSRETDATNPISLYGRYKLESEAVVLAADRPNFTTVSLRCATLCGASPRPRLDLTMNILTYHAISRGLITVNGGGQIRPQLHVRDAVDAYVRLIDASSVTVGGQAFNLARVNVTVLAGAELVRGIIGPDIEVAIAPVHDARSYALSSAKIGRALGIRPWRPVADAVRELARSLRRGDIEEPESGRHRNVVWMSAIEAQAVH